MKNSLFKRALAAVSAVPIALTQCLTISSFAADNDVPAASGVEEVNDSITLQKLLYIAPNSLDSTWNFQVSGILDQAFNSGKGTGEIDVTAAANFAANYARSYSDVVKAIASKVESVKYNVNEDGDVTITAKVGNVSEALSENVANALGSAAQKLADKYNAPELADIDFETVDISGTVKVTVKSSSLAGSTTIPVEFSFTDSELNTYDAAGTLKYIDNKLAELKKVAYDAIESVKDLDADAAKAAKADFDKAIGKYENLIVKAKKAIDKALSLNVSKTYGSASELLSAVNNFLAKKGINAKLPASGAAIMSNAKVASAYNGAMSQLEAISPVAIDIEANEIGAFIDDLSNIEVSVSGGQASLKAEFTDAEKAAVKAYYDTIADKEFVDSVKHIEVTVDFASALAASKGSVDVKIYRTIEDKDVQTTTTTEEVTSSSTTESSSSTTESSSSTTESSSSTTESSSSTTESSSSTTESSSSTTESSSSTTESSSSTTESSSSTTESSSSTTESSSSTTESSSSTTESTSSSTETSTTTTTVVRVEDSYVDVKSEDGFYLSIDEAFTADQITEAKLYVKNKTVSIDEEGNETVISEDQTSYDILGKVDFGTQTPGSLYDVTNTTFMYNVNLYFAGDEMTDEAGNVVLTKGQQLKTSVGDATVTAFIGLKGDADLDNRITAYDASLILTYYTNRAKLAYDKVQISDSTLVTSPTCVYEDFVAFLCDIDTAISPDVAWKTGKKDRLLLANDASFILTYYTYGMKYEKGAELWAKVIAGTVDQA